MECPSCHLVNHDDAKFCAKCGQYLLSEVTCPQCDTTNHLTSKFCKNCGYSFDQDDVPSSATRTARPTMIPSKPTQGIHRALSQSRWLIAVTSGAIGVALWFGLGYAVSDTIRLADTLAGQTGIILGIAAGCFLVTGLIAGFWARQKSAGVAAAMVLLVGNTIYNFIRGTYEGSRVEIIVMYLAISAVCALIIGFVGGLIGEKVRG